jgi:hypothetical protein
MKRNADCLVDLGTLRDAIGKVQAEFGAAEKLAAKLGCTLTWTVTPQQFCDTIRKSVDDLSDYLSKKVKSAHLADKKRKIDEERTALVEQNRRLVQRLAELEKEAQWTESDTTAVHSLVSMAEKEIEAARSMSTEPQQTTRAAEVEEGDDDTLLSDLSLLSQQQTDRVTTRRSKKH